MANSILNMPEIQHLPLYLEKTSFSSYIGTVCSLQVHSALEQILKRTETKPKLRMLVHYIGMGYRTAWVKREGKQGCETKSCVNSYFTKKFQTTQQFAWQMLYLAVWNSNRLAARRSHGIKYSMGRRKRGSTSFSPDFYFPLPRFTQEFNCSRLSCCLIQPLWQLIRNPRSKSGGGSQKFCASGWLAKL